MPYLNAFHLILALTCGYALLRGRSDERWVAATCIAASVATRLTVSPVLHRYSGVEIGVFVVDLATFAAFTFVALRTKRFWPLWIAGLQLTTVMAHLLKAIDTSLFPVAYAAAGRLWSYPILLILAVGTWRSRHRLMRRDDQATPA
jgi:hypothetical protein